eukprot:scaffold25663_cov63-Phaeocystis_antarctica.AAC.7
MPRAAPTYATAACAPRLPAPSLPAPRLPARCLPRLHRLVACRIRTREACRPSSATPPPPSLLACAMRCNSAPSRLLEPATRTQRSRSVPTLNPRSAPGARLAVTVRHGQSQTVAVGAAQQQPVAVPHVSILWLDVL